MAVRSVSLCSGIGGLDIGVDIAFGGPGEVVPICYVEREIAAARILAQRIEDGALPPAPIWSDITTFDGRRLRGLVDIVTAGFPCPDYSVAGKRNGRFGEYGQVWDHVIRVVREMGPNFVVLENVFGIIIPHKRRSDGRILPAGLWFVLGDLAESGYNAEWLCIRASDLGAPHRRERWFCLAWKQELEHANLGRCRQRKPQERPNEKFGTGCLAAVSDTGGSGYQGGEFGASLQCIEGAKTYGTVAEFRCALFPPRPYETDRWEDVCQRRPHLAPTIEPGFRVVVDGVSVVVDESKRTQLRALGNAVIPLQAAVAIRKLLERI